MAYIICEWLINELYTYTHHIYVYTNIYDTYM